MMSRGGTLLIKPRSGKTIAPLGMSKRRFDAWGFSRIFTSRVASIAAMKRVKAVNSSVKFVEDVMSTPSPYQWFVIGQNS